MTSVSLSATYSSKKHRSSLSEEVLIRIFHFSEVARVREALGFQFSSILQCLAMFLASSALGFLISWRMALVFLSPVPVLLLRALTLGEKIGEAANEARALWSQADSIQVETLEKLDTVVAHGQQRETITRFGAKLESAVEAFFQKFHLAAWGRAIIFLSIYGSYAGAFWYGCRLLLQDQITPGGIYAVSLGFKLWRQKFNLARL